MIVREDLTMSEKMLVTQALDERDLLVKKIADKITKAKHEAGICYSTEITCKGSIWQKDDTKCENIRCQVISHQAATGRWEKLQFHSYHSGSAATSFSDGGG